MQSLLEQRPEVGDEIIDNIRRSLDRVNNRLTLSNTRFVERYIKQELNILVNFGVRGVLEQFVAHFHHLPLGELSVDIGMWGQTGVAPLFSPDVGTPELRNRNFTLLPP